MSDGPHRSLPMSKGWKKVAEWADNSNFDSGQIAEILAQEVVRDFRKAIPEGVITLLIREFQDREGDLFPDERTQCVVNIDQLLDGSPLGRLLFDCAEQRLDAGEVGQQGIETAVRSAVREQLLRRERQIEEHYLRCRESSVERAAKVRAGIEGGIGQVSVEEVARRVLRLAPSRSSRAGQRTGVDEGVPLR